jgi:Flp pilus assembly protein TadD
MIPRKGAMSIMHESSGDNDRQAIQDEMVSLGERLMSAGRMEEAQQVFSRVARFYPEAAATYARLCEFYMMRGDGKRARRNFARSLELCPENPDVRDKLSLLGGRT